MLAIPRKEFTSEELEFLESMRRLQDIPSFQRLVEAVERERVRYLTNLAGGIGFVGGATAPPVDQREIDYKRGFWNGAIYAVSRFPNMKAKDWDKFVAETKESDES